MLSYNSSSKDYGSTITKTADREEVCLDPTFLIQSALQCASLQDRPVRTRNVIFETPPTIIPVATSDQCCNIQQRYSTPVPKGRGKMKYIVGFLFVAFGLLSGFFSVVSKQRFVLLGYLNLIIALFFLFITLFFGVVLGGAVDSDARFLSLFILGSVATLFFGFISYTALRKR
jgi:hypothetical protein